MLNSILHASEKSLKGKFTFFWKSRIMLKRCALTVINARTSLHCVFAHYKQSKLFENAENACVKIQYKCTLIQNCYFKKSLNQQYFV